MGLRSRFGSSPIVKYDVTVGKHDDFPEYSLDQLKRRTEVQNATMELFKVLSGNYDLKPNDIDYNCALNIIDLAADHLAYDKGYAVYYPEYRTCIDSDTGKYTKTRYIQDYYNQYSFYYNEKGECIKDE